MKRLLLKIGAVLGVVLVAGAIYVLATGTTLAPRTVSANPSVTNEDTLTTLYQTYSPAVVEIQVSEQGTGIYGSGIQQGQGSGFLIDSAGDILTNDHVVDGATSVQVILKDGTNLPATITGTDATDDLALVKVDASAVSKITPLVLGDSSTVEPGQLAVALGSPYGLTDSITAGIISGVNRTLSGSGLTGLLQTDASINPGNSGGPLLNSSGQVIGINTAVESVASGIGFAVPSNTASRALPDLKAGKQVARPWLGISGVDLNATLAKNLNLTVTQGAYVVTVTSGSPADKAGLKGGGTDNNGAPAAGGDVITAVDGKPVSSVSDLSSYFNTKKVGDTVTLKVLRNGSTMDVSATLGAWPTSTPSTPSIPRTIPRVPWGGRQGQTD